jgi:hypothetical protein
MKESASHVSKRAGEMPLGLSFPRRISFRSDLESSGMNRSGGISQIDHYHPFDTLNRLNQIIRRGGTPRADELRLLKLDRIPVEAPDADIESTKGAKFNFGI